MIIIIIIIINLSKLIKWMRPHYTCCCQKSCKTVTIVFQINAQMSDITSIRHVSGNCNEFGYCWHAHDIWL